MSTEQKSKNWIITEQREIEVHGQFAMTKVEAFALAFSDKTADIRGTVVSDRTERTARASDS